jgi:signal transduction histidine kinase
LYLVKIWDRLSGLAATAGLAATFVVAIAFEAVAIAGSWGRGYWLVGGSAAVLVCALALVRRRQREWTALAGMGIAGLAITAARVFHLPTEPGPAMALALAVLVGSAVRALPAVRAAVVATSGLAVAGGAYLAARPQSSSAAAVVAMNVGTWLGAVGLGVALRSLDERARATADKVRREERLELARELHDVVAHHITGMVIQAQAAQVVARKNPGQATESLTEIETAGTEALRAMRRVVGLLRDTDDAPPVSAEPEHLGALVERFSRQGPPVRLRVTQDRPDWPPEITSTVYRIVREALTNVARHAPHAGNVAVTIGQNPTGITIEVTDDAPASPARPPHRGGFGLVGMRERVETLGGTLRAGPLPGAGWSVLAAVPIHNGRPE